MLLSFTPNACLERVISIPNFAAGHSHRVNSTQIFQNVGGKGLNAARVAGNLGLKTHSLAPLGPNFRNFLPDLAQNEGLQVEWLATNAPTRVCTLILDENRASTEIVEAGNALPIAFGTQILERFQRLLPACDLALLGGSYPVSHNPSWDWHAAILSQMARAQNKKLIYDGKGAAFQRAVFSPTPPWGIKPNLAEMSELLNRDIESQADERRAIRELLARGIEVVWLSCGARGAYCGFQNQIEWFDAPKVEEISPIGSGDSFVGAFAAKFIETNDVFDATRWAVAAGAANARERRSAFVSRSQIEELLPLVTRKLVEMRLL